MVSVVAKEMGEFDTGSDMLRSNLCDDDREKRNYANSTEEEGAPESPCKFQLLFSYNFSTA